MHQVAERNGAAIALLRFLRWFKMNSRRPFSVLLGEGGELTGEFADLSRTWAAGNSHWCPGGLRSQVMGAVGFEALARRAERSDLRKFAVRSHPALVYLNGFSSTNFRLTELLDLKVPMMTHVHELGLLFRRQAGPAMPRMLSATRRFIACSQAVKKNLICHHGVASDRVEVVYESIAVGNVRASRSRADVLRELGFPTDAQLVVGSGNAIWNKGADVFVQLGRIVCQQRSRAHFAWVGDTGEIPQFEHDLRMLGLAERIRFTGLVGKPADYFAAADVFVLTSREDSFPLVCLEAAALGKPIICFADAGGMPEFVEDDCGSVVPYLDVEAMANRVIALLNSPECSLAMGANARRKVAERHDVDTAAPLINEIIERTIAQ